MEISCTENELAKSPCNTLRSKILKVFSIFGFVAGNKKTQRELLFEFLFESLGTSNVMFRLYTVDHEVLIKHGCTYQVREFWYTDPDHKFENGVYTSPNGVVMESMTKIDLRFALNSSAGFIERELVKLGIDYTK